MLKELTDSGKSVSMQIAGNSMSPFLIHRRDYIYFEKPKRPLKKGDMVFYQRDNGQYVMHRICRLHTNNESNITYDIIGDAQLEIEKGIRRDQIFAIITQVKRKGEMIGPNDFRWKFFEKVWVNIIPFRRAAEKIYSFIYKIRK